jgi:hypothetical protein
MDEAKACSHIEDHADAVVRGDMDAVVADFKPELRPQVPHIAQVLPRPVTSADVMSVEIGDDESVAMIRYSGETEEVTVRSLWREIDGRPLIIHAEPVG